MADLDADYIVQSNLTCYFNNDTDRRRHLYFSRRDAGWPPVGGPRALLSPGQFVREYHLVKDRVQKAICERFLLKCVLDQKCSLFVVRSIGWWEEDRTGRYEEPHPNALHDWYRDASNEHKILISMFSLFPISAGAEYNS